MRSRLVCPGCTKEVPGLHEAPLPFRCPGAEADPSVDHVLARRLDDLEPISPVVDEPNPFLRFRALDHVYLAARETGLSDQRYVEIVRRADHAIARREGHGFSVTPLHLRKSLGEALGFSHSNGGVWVKDETENVAGSHKGRHLFAVLVHLEVVRELGLAKPSSELVIASCGNAALAAAVLAAALERPLRVFVPEDAEPPVIAKIASLGATIEVCPREPGVPGDPTYHRFRAAVRAGAIPFSCQGPDQALAVQGGKSLAWEIAFSDQPFPQRIFVQVGGGALASGLFSGLEEAVKLGLIASLPRLHPVQTQGAFPLVRAYERLVADIERSRGLSPLENDAARAERLRDVLGERGIDEALRDAAQRRAEYMWPWEETPKSLAHGILDDETYDWIGVLRGTLLSAGHPVLVSEDEVREAHALGRKETGIDVCPTGTASLAGLLALSAKNPPITRERVLLPFTGKRR